MSEAEKAEERLEVEALEFRGLEVRELKETASNGGNRRAGKSRT